jgi:hypothetical protein
MTHWTVTAFIVGMAVFTGSWFFVNRLDHVK